MSSLLAQVIAVVIRTLVKLFVVEGFGLSTVVEPAKRNKDDERFIDAAHRDGWSDADRLRGK